MRFAKRREEDREENGGQISYRDSKNGLCPQRNFRGKDKSEQFKIPARKNKEGGVIMLYLSFLRSPIGTGLTEIRGKVEMEPCDWLLANEEVSRLSGD